MGEEQVNRDCIMTNIVSLKTFYYGYIKMLVLYHIIDFLSIYSAVLTIGLG
jgi:hypothetical protein